MVVVVLVVLVVTAEGDLELNDGVDNDDDLSMDEDHHMFEQAAMRPGELDDETVDACCITGTKDEE
jgi:hypothetical protein